MLKLISKDNIPLEIEDAQLDILVRDVGKYAYQVFYNRYTSSFSFTKEHPYYKENKASIFERIKQLGRSFEE